ncbi:hypothetical protein [Hymenobacter algoricola]|uniref:STAS domain-containing protein n=1 Tax=Hymenobacter algoricola TaxID=486267 RepID=A0ABP7MWE6_9BACT
MKSTWANFTPYLVRIDLDTVNCAELARHLVRSCPVRHPRLLIDCHRLRCLRTQGVAYCVSQLLLLHAAGAQVQLLNVGPLLGRCLYLLGLHRVFGLRGPRAQPA